MIKNISSLLLTGLIALPAPAFAHKLHAHGSGCHHDGCNHEAEVQLSPEIPLSQEEVARLVEGSHEVLEADHHAGFFKRWASAFNLKSKFIDAYRWGSAKTKDPRFKDVVTDSLLLFGISHLIEMSSGPLLLAAGANNDWPEWLMMAIGAGGVTISIPGLDPMCILIFGAYAKSEDFRKGVGFVRGAIMKPINKAWSALGMTDVLAKLFKSQEVSQLEGLNKVDTDGAGQSTLYFSYPMDNPIVDLEIQNDVNGVYIHAVTIHKNSLSNLNKSEFKEWIKPLGWNARNLISKVLQITQQEQDLHAAFNKLYVKSVKQNNSINRVELVKHSVGVAKGACSSALAE